MQTNYLEVPPKLVNRIPSNLAWEYKILPKNFENKTLELYVDKDNCSDLIKEELEILLNVNVALFPYDTELINNTLKKEYRKSSPNKNKKAEVVNVENDDAIFQLIKEAHDLGSSDIHIETYEDTCRIRIRIDGKLIERQLIDNKYYPSLVNKIKIKSNLDIAEKRLPQDGRLQFAQRGLNLDIRISSLPTLFGEKLVLRLLNKDTANIDINKLGFDPDQLKTYLESLKKPHGIIIISGPTGSGKTTTLYATLKILNKNDVNILTIEDPIEYTLDGINQVQLKESIGLTYTSALRTFLRQDPDIIMVGEIRDPDTAQMAIRSALTGHLILSTLHTNSASGIVSRLIDIGIPSYLLKSTLNMAIAQRLVRILCPDCKERKDFNDEVLPLNIKPSKPILHYYSPVGCNNCYHTGYKGRQAIYEIIDLGAEVVSKLDFENIEDSIIANNIEYNKLADLALALFEDGKTSIEEIFPILTNK